MEINNYSNIFIRYYMLINVFAFILLFIPNENVLAIMIKISFFVVSFALLWLYRAELKIKKEEHYVLHMIGHYSALFVWMSLTFRQDDRIYPWLHIMYVILGCVNLIYVILKKENLNKNLVE